MKTKLILVCALVALSLSVFACAPSTGSVSTEVSCDDFMDQNHVSKEVEVAAGNSFTVTLCSNASTGFQWTEKAQISDQAVLEQLGHETVAPGAGGDKPPAPGTAGKEVWTFKALKKGTSAISLEYSRPWEGGEKGVWTFNLTVVVN